MFRKMRRTKQQLSEQEVLQILENGQTGVLGVIGDHGYPYTVPVNYVYTEGKIYIHGAREGHKLDAIKHCDKVSFCVIEKADIIASELTTAFKSVILFGKAKILQEENEIFHGAQLLGLKYSSDKNMIEQAIKGAKDVLSVIEITIDHISGKGSINV